MQWKDRYERACANFTQARIPVKWKFRMEFEVHSRSAILKRKSGSVPYSIPFCILQQRSVVCWLLIETGAEYMCGEGCLGVYNRCVVSHLLLGLVADKIP